MPFLGLSRCFIHSFTHVLCALPRAPVQDGSEAKVLSTTIRQSLAEAYELDVSIRETFGFGADELSKEDIAVMLEVDMNE